MYATKIWETKWVVDAWRRGSVTLKGRESHIGYMYVYERDSEWTWDRDTERVFTVSHYTPLSEWVREREREREREGEGGDCVGVSTCHWESHGVYVCVREGG